MFKQLELFETPRDIEKEMEDLKADMGKLRRSLFAQQADLRKMYQEIAHDHQLMRLNICKGRLVV